MCRYRVKVNSCLNERLSANICNYTRLSCVFLLYASVLLLTVCKSYLSSAAFWNSHTCVVGFNSSFNCLSVEKILWFIGSEVPDYQQRSVYTAARPIIDHTVTWIVAHLFRWVYIGMFLWGIIHVFFLFISSVIWIVLIKVLCVIFVS